MMIYLNTNKFALTFNLFYICNKSDKLLKLSGYDKSIGKNNNGVLADAFLPENQ